MKPLLLICGPTACHKSETALRIGERWGGEILSIDSVAVYRGLDIGSAKPDPSERRRVPHHLIDIVEPDDRSFSVAAFQRAADEVLADLVRRNVQPILVGGSGLYCDAVLEDMGYALPSDAALRKQLEAEYDADPQTFFDRMAKDDVPSGEKLHLNDKKRVVRAREVFLLSGKPFSSFNQAYSAAQRNSRYPAIRVGLTMPREKLYAAIDARVDRMMDQGLLEEVKGLRDKGYDRRLPAMQAIGYAQLLSFLEGEVTMDAAVDAIKRSTRQFAKRQLTWFRRDERIRWFDCADYGAAYEQIEEYVRETVFHDGCI
ncbi:MAG: tRNA (adenosine(37)-N6)-dimethylallyltransferase MiaA [Clostridia bacterium]|nr:tRNA (adenosine(37)-N6)-dimethylallyltransferase MiaA [Clostridia bacterium]MBQ6866398.1 tRNA (adenosine(37)-N6)-dimethylallyltransferase MiaA [Clostridia bacterium]MBR0421416.1 tRNA (adenosine(37)-N6)-dimethylallyltransferase MiaA [Clostridia bacterium]